MPSKKPEPLVGFKNMRDILHELENERLETITSKVDELVDAGRRASASRKLDGLAGADKKDGGKDCGTDGKESSENGTGKEACDLPLSQFSYGDPGSIDRESLAQVEATKEQRTQSLLSRGPVI
ncbi:hypothetical protein ACFQZ2_02750 [Streptomonospora algeriensis]|uniref:Uncharacterized protein n=1 Tax=Streptomonospora algeriensis TaxID=995084 RepID=A0ABW3BB31_9ACTN